MTEKTIKKAIELRKTKASNTLTKKGVSKEFNSETFGKLKRENKIAFYTPQFADKNNSIKDYEVGFKAFFKDENVKIKEQEYNPERYFSTLIKKQEHTGQNSSYKACLSNMLGIVKYYNDRSITPIKNMKTALENEEAEIAQLTKDLENEKKREIQKKGQQI